MIRVEAGAPLTPRVVSVVLEAVHTATGAPRSRVRSLVARYLGTDRVTPELESIYREAAGPRHERGHRRAGRRSTCRCGRCRTCRRLRMYHESIEAATAGARTPSVLGRLPIGDVMASCTRKMRHVSRAEADAKIAEYALVRPWHRLRAYHCTLCDGWHLTRSAQAPEAIRLLAG